MRKQVKKPDYSGVDALNELKNHLTISIKHSDEPQIVKGYTAQKGVFPHVKDVTIPDFIYKSIESWRIAKNEEDRKELFSRKWSEYKTIHEKHSIPIFIESEIQVTAEKIAKVKRTVKNCDEYDVYRLAKEWRYFLKEHAEKSDIEKNAPKPTIEKISDSKSKLTLRQIALIHVYNKQSITRENCSEIAIRNGHTSGEKLYQHFTNYSSRANRTAKTNSLKTFDNKIKLFTGILDFLSSEAKLWASDEIKTLKAAFERQDF